MTPKQAKKENKQSFILNKYFATKRAYEMALDRKNMNDNQKNKAKRRRKLAP